MMRTRNKLSKILVLVAVTVAMTLAFAIQASAATVATLSWWLADSGKHLDWDGSTTYQTQFNAAVTTWNNYKSGVIRPDSLSVVQDVAISDYSEVSSVAGVTSSAGTIKFNTYVMGGLTTTQRQNVCTHELGHALGLAHNLSGDVMYAYVSTVTSLSANDKASYDSSYTRF
jgi:hypothetical protein